MKRVVQLEAVLQPRAHRFAAAHLIITHAGDRAVDGAEQMLVPRALDVIACADVEIRRDAAHRPERAEARFDACHIVAAVARAGVVGEDVRAAGRAVRVIAARPVARRVVAVDGGAERGRAAERYLVCQRGCPARDRELVTRGWMLVGRRAEERVGESDVGGVRAFIIEAQFRAEVAERGAHTDLARDVADVVVESVEVVGAALEGRDESARGAACATELHLGELLSTAAATRIDSATHAHRRLGGDVVDDAADGLRSEEDRPAALDDLDARHAIDRRRIVHIGFAVRCERDGDTVLEHEHAAAAVGVEAADADVDAQAGALLFLDVHSRHSAQHLVGGEWLLCADLPFADGGRCAGDPREGIRGGTYDGDAGQFTRRSGEHERRARDLVIADDHRLLFERERVGAHFDGLPTGRHSGNPELTERVALAAEGRAYDADDGARDRCRAVGAGDASGDGALGGDRGGDRCGNGSGEGGAVAAGADQGPDRAHGGDRERERWEPASRPVENDSQEG